MKMWEEQYPDEPCPLKPVSDRQQEAKARAPPALPSQTQKVI